MTSMNILKAAAVLLGFFFGLGVGGIITPRKTALQQGPCGVTEPGKITCPWAAKGHFIRIYGVDEGPVTDAADLAKLGGAK